VVRSSDLIGHASHLQLDDPVPPGRPGPRPGLL